MKVKELVEILKSFNQDSEVTITDGFRVVHYHTNNVEIKSFEDQDYDNEVVDIGIGGNER